MSIFPKLSISKALIIVLVFSFSVEFFQLINIVEILNFQPPKIIMIVLGSSFSLWDLLAYAPNTFIILEIEYIFTTIGHIIFKIKRYANFSLIFSSNLLKT